MRSCAMRRMRPSLVRQGCAAGTTAAEHTRETIGKLQEAKGTLTTLVERYPTAVESYAARYNLSIDSVSKLLAEKVLVDTIQTLRSIEPILFDVFREYRHSPRERRTLEEALKLLHKQRIGIPPKKPEIDKKIQVAVEAVAIASIDIAISTLEKGDVCEKNECAVAACFRVVNTGHFDSKVMALSEQTAAESAKLVTDKGFSELCYGDVYVTQQIHRSKVLAFYVFDEDRMYVRAKPKRGEEALAIGTFIHELGHRLDGKFLSDAARREMQRLFAEWRARRDRSKFSGGIDLKPGVQIADPKKPGVTYVIDSVEYTGRGVTGQTVKLHLAEDEKVRFRAPYETVMQMAGAARADNPFPSDYAATEPRELFAELFYAVVVGQATDEQKAGFERILRAGRVGKSFGRAHSTRIQKDACRLSDMTKLTLAEIAPSSLDYKVEV